MMVRKLVGSTLLVSVVFVLGVSCAPTDRPVDAGSSDASQGVSSMKWSTLSGTPPIIIAHRGASGYRPEHTLAGYELAIAQGADVIEPDLVFTKDGVLVARHDRYLSTSTDVADHPEFADKKRRNPDPNGEAREDWWAEDFTLAEIKSLRARQAFPGRSTEYDGQYEIPTFDEILTLATEQAKTLNRSVGVYPETKHPDYLESIGLDFEDPMLSALRGFDAGPVYIQSFGPSILKRISGKTDAKLIQLVHEESPGSGSNIPLAEIAAYADGVGPAKAIVLPDVPILGGVDFVTRAHELGLLVHPWTFRKDQPAGPGVATISFPVDSIAAKVVKSDAEVEFYRYFAAGVDGVFTDFPDIGADLRDALADGED
ncbi:glycerophosphodiester phosphodiesterase family protein [Hyphococcus lacteus]|uniref:glycerophosphodiester phosphodiesterase n=1 Tax=Hyphococcus lacteus TaxID=3143536 RepID=A0ABV3Z1E8_9PROT